MKHLVTETVRGVVTTKCGVTFKGEEAATDTTVWYSEVDCPECRPYEYIREDDGTLVKKARGESTPPKPRVMRRRSKSGA